MSFLNIYIYSFDIDNLNLYELILTFFSSCSIIYLFFMIGWNYIYFNKGNIFKPIYILIFLCLYYNSSKKHRISFFLYIALFIFIIISNMLILNIFISGLDLTSLNSYANL